MDDYRDDYRHNIFDMNVAPPSAAAAPGAYHAAHFDSYPQKEFFNSTVPSLNPRYDPIGDNPGAAVNHSANGSNIFGHNAPSPDAFSTSRSRSHSREHAGSPWDANRPPSSSGGSAGGPVRTQTRSRRERNSFSSTSPPPGVRYGRPNPNPIAIPRSSSSTGAGAGAGGASASPIGISSSAGGTWAPGSASTTTDSFALPPTPDSILHSFHIPTGSSSPDHHNPAAFHSYHPHVPLPPLHEGHNSPKSASPPPASYQFHNMQGFNHTGAHSYHAQQGPGISSSLPQLSSLPQIHHQYLAHHQQPGPHQQPHQQPSPSLTHSSAGGAISASPPSTNGVRSKSIGPSVTKEDKASLIANEKKRRRRESHNAVERRRRDNINEKISELATLIPECMLDGNSDPALTPNSTPLVPASPSTPNNSSSASGALAPAGENGSETSEPSTTENFSLDQAGLLNTFGITHTLDTLPENPPTSPTSANSQNNIVVKTETPQSQVSAAGQVVKANKGVILRKSVEYIRYLQQLVNVQGARNRELEAELRAVKGVPGRSGGESSGSNSGSAFSLNTMGLGMSPMTVAPMMGMIPTSSGAASNSNGQPGVDSAASTITPGNALRTPTPGGMEENEANKAGEGMSPRSTSPSDSSGLSGVDDGDSGDGDMMLVDEVGGIERGRGRKRA